jgi:hypothetical protein
MPAISIREFQESAFTDYGATWNDILLWSEPAVPRHELLTANNQVPYMLTFLNLRRGPVVVDIPAAGEKALLFGSFVDNWQAPIVDVGPSGTDEGRGGKYLFLPPGYSEPIPEGYPTEEITRVGSRRSAAVQGLLDQSSQHPRIIGATCIDLIGKSWWSGGDSN